MAGKKETPFMSSFIPQSESKYASLKWKWGGINKVNTLDSGGMTSATGISTSKYPYLASAEIPSVMYNICGEEYLASVELAGKTVFPLSLHGFSDFLLCAYGEAGVTGVYPGTLGEDKLSAGRSISGNALTAWSKTYYQCGEGYTEALKIVSGTPSSGEIALSTIQNEITDLSAVFYGKDALAEGLYVTLVQYRIDVGSKELLENYKSTLIPIPVTGGKYYRLDTLFTNSYGGHWRSYKSDGTNVPLSVRYYPNNTDGKRTGTIYVDTQISYIEFIANVGYDWTKFSLEESSVTYMDRYQNGGISIGTLSTTVRASSNVPRCVVQFNVYTSNDVLDGEFQKKLLIFPDKVSTDFDTSGNMSFSAMETAEILIPDLNHVTVYQSRLFGVDSSRIYASGFNDYTNWELDTAGADSVGANAWCSTAGSNTKAYGDFTGITTYNNHVEAFKGDFAHQLYNTENPFRITDISTDGADNNFAIAEANGILFFVSKSRVNAFSGGDPVSISDVLGISDYTGSRTGSYNDSLYLYCPQSPSVVYTYSAINGLWGSVSYDYATYGDVLNFASNKNGIYALTKNGYVIQFNSGIYTNNGGAAWTFDTDFMALGKMNIRRIKKITLDVEFSGKLTLSVLDSSHVSTGVARTWLDDEFANASYALTLDDKFVVWKKYYTKSGSVYTRASVVSGASVTANTYYEIASVRCQLRLLTRGTSAFGHYMRISGTGKAKIYSSEIQYSYGGDIYG